MKTIFTLLTSMIMSMALLAAPVRPNARAKGMLIIKSLDQGDIRVIIDGKRFEPRFSSMALNNVNAGVHSVKIYRERNTGLFSIFGKRYEVVFNKSVMVRPNTQLAITIDRFGRPSMIEQKMRGNGRDRDWNNGRNRNDQRGRDGRFDDDEFDFDHDGRFGDYDNDYGYDNSYMRAMSDREFNQVMQAIQKEWFEGNKVKSASQIIATNYLTSAQVKQMLSLFAFENNKLDLAKQAYGKAVDQRNFLLIVGQVFSHQSSKDELARYVRSYR